MIRTASFEKKDQLMRCTNIFKSMNKLRLNAALLLFFSAFTAFSQGPAVTSWLQNTTQNGSYYVSGNSTAITNNIPYNCQEVSYSADYVYVKTGCVPSYPTGPFLDGNPSNASDQNAIFKIPLSPVENTGTPTATNAGKIGVFINGVSLYDYRDGVSWNPTTNALCGGPGNPPCPGGMGAVMDWNRDAVPAEMGGFDCAKGHPANGDYHHHQNPSAFDLDLNVVSTICNLYDADGLYAINSSVHSPLLGYAYDGFPIYGAYGYANVNGTGGIVRIKSSYQLASYSVRTNYPDGTDVDDGPAVSATYPLGYFREDYQYVAQSGEDYLDEHNGRFCVTPEYPSGTYAYFCTVDENWNSAYPYAVGPTFYGVSANRLVTSISEAVTVYTPSSSISETDFEAMEFKVFPNPASDLIAVQLKGLTKYDLELTLVDISGKIVATNTIHAGQTISYFDSATVYPGTYFVKITANGFVSNHKVIVQ